jgi:hypothetical protein
MRCNIQILCFVILGFNSDSFAQRIQAAQSTAIFSAIKGSVSKPDTIALYATRGSDLMGKLKISGEHSSFFVQVSSTPKRLSANEQQHLIFVFKPSENFVGIAKAELTISGMSEPIKLIGLSTNGLEGENEAPLSRVVEALGYTTDIGWTTLPNNLSPTLQGSELKPTLFQKANEGAVEMIPVARYSPDFLLNFGYYVPSSRGPVQHQAGILAKADKYPEHQTLFPAMAHGSTSFDPGQNTFGFYAISPGHTVYSEDVWNILLYPTHAAHAMRIYPLRSQHGEIRNSYLVCMEEAANGDYNDYVFIVRNVKPVPLDDEFVALFNGKNLAGWYTWLQSQGKNSDPDKVFTVEEGGILHDQGSELGYIMTERSFGNFHFVLEFRWGQKRYPPRESNKRDSGICYNIPEDEPDHIWPQSIECQIQEGDVGDFWLLDYSTIQVDGKQNSPSPHTQMIKRTDAENPTGEWNTVEVISFFGKCVHIVNGVVVNYGENASRVGGKLLLQSEYAEIYYRNVRIRPL